MAEARPSKLRSVGKSSDVLPDIYCNICYEVDGEVLEAEGFCQDCVEFLCLVCFTSHRRVKQTRSHQLLDKYNMPKIKPKIKPQHFNTENCFHHQSENIKSYCKSCDRLCCKICFTVDHHGCKVEKLSTIAVNIQHSQELKDLKNRLDILKRGYSDHQIKANKHLGNIEKYYTEAINDMKKIQEEVDRLLDETMKQAEKVKAEDLQTVETISSTCEILEEQIDNIKASLNKKENHKQNEAVFIAMKQALSQLKSFEDRLGKLNTDNTIHQYKFEPEEKLQYLLNELEVLGKLCFSNDKASAGPMLTKPLHVEDIDVQTSQVRCSILLPNKQILLTDNNTKLVKLFDMKQKKILAQHQLPGFAWDIIQIKQEEFAATTCKENSIQFLKVTSASISKVREISVDGDSYGLVYNDQNKTLVVSYLRPGKIEIMTLTGTVIKSIEKDANGAQLFTEPNYIAQSHDKTMMYISDRDRSSVTLMTLDGRVKAVYKNDALKRPYGICVNRSGIVFVVDYESNTVHQIMPGSDKLELLLDKKDGLVAPIAITYCDVEDKIYLGQQNTSILKVFKMK